MQHFYDGQIRRYITQIVRLMSNFTYEDGKGKLTQVPVMYGDITRQVGSILRDNSENKIPSAPRMAVYITGLEMDRTRTADSSYIHKLNVRERAYDENGQEYLKTSGKNYTVERLMPTPYTLSVNVDIWTTNTEQKLQIMEQILMLFNPSLEIQTTDNYVDWTSLSVVNLENINFSSRSIPVGTESEIDVATLGFETPIYISPPTKVKRLGVITNIITSVFNEQQGTIELDLSRPVQQAYDDAPKSSSNQTETIESPARPIVDREVIQNVDVAQTGDITTKYASRDITKTDTDFVISTSHRDYDLLILNSTGRLGRKGVLNVETWTGYLEAMPELFESGITEIRLKRADLDNEITGTFVIDPSDEYQIIINWDDDSLPSDTVISGPTGDKTKIDYIIDPLKSNPTNLKTTGVRILLLGAIGDPDNTDGADAWKNNDNSDFVASENDIVEWDGSEWSIVFDASESETTIYQTNLNTGVQYKWDGTQWLLSFEGEYPNGSWRLQY